MCWSLSVAKGEATSETKVSEKERRFPAPAGEAASSSPQPQGSRGLAPGTRTDARSTTHPGSGQSLPARRTTTVTPAPTTPPMPPLPLRAAGSLPEKQLRLRAARHRLLRPRLVPQAGFLTASSIVVPGSPWVLVLSSRGRSGHSNCFHEMPAGVREGGARRLLASSACAFKTSPELFVLYYGEWNPRALRVDTLPPPLSSAFLLPSFCPLPGFTGAEGPFQRC